MYNVEKLVPYSVLWVNLICVCIFQTLVLTSVPAAGAAILQVSIKHGAGGSRGVRVHRG